jgi:hypothetical protein
VTSCSGAAAGTGPTDADRANAAARTDLNHLLIGLAIGAAAGIREPFS